MSFTFGTYETLLTKVDGAVATITVNRPDVLNALNLKVIAELTQAFTAVGGTPDVRVVILAGAGDRAFIAGADIGAMSQMGPKEAMAFSRAGQRLTTTMENIPQIIIAKVQGFALGGGCEVAMACDIVVAVKRAKFGQPEVGLGLIAGFGGTQRLVRRVGLPLALDILTASRTLTGEEAAAAGLISRTCEKEQLDEEVALVVRGVLKGAPAAVAETKRLTRQAYQMTLEAGLAAEAASFGTCFGQDAEEAREGTGAFLEKRKPKFCL